MGLLFRWERNVAYDPEGKGELNRNVTYSVWRWAACQCGVTSECVNEHGYYQVGLSSYWVKDIPGVRKYEQQAPTGWKLGEQEAMRAKAHYAQ